MFCSQCKNLIYPDDKFCSKCGSMLNASQNHPTTDAVGESSIPDFGSVKTKWWGETPLKFQRPETYNWLNSAIHLLVFQDHFAIVPGHDKGIRGSDVAGALGLLGGFLLLSRALKDKIRNEADVYDSARALSQFDAGQLLWCINSSAEIWEIKHRRGVEPDSLRGLYCPLTSRQGILPFLFPLEKPEGIVLNPISNLKCSVRVKAVGLSENEGYAAYLHLFEEVRGEKAISFKRY